MTRPYIIAVDFDGTLCEDKYPDIGRARADVIAELKDRQRKGDWIILWTCRHGKELGDAVVWCINYGLLFDGVNENHPDLIAVYGDTRKVFADEYWDDKARPA